MSVDRYALDRCFRAKGADRFVRIVCQQVYDDGRLWTDVCEVC